MGGRGRDGLCEPRLTSPPPLPSPVEGEGVYTEWITRGLQDDTSTPEGRPEPNTFNTVSPMERALP
jgi:hypothetical protein